MTGFIIQDQEALSESLLQALNHSPSMQLYLVTLPGLQVPYAVRLWGKRDDPVPEGTHLSVEDLSRGIQSHPMTEPESSKPHDLLDDVDFKAAYVSLLQSRVPVELDSVLTSCTVAGCCLTLRVTQFTRTQALLNSHPMYLGLLALDMTPSGKQGVFLWRWKVPAVEWSRRASEPYKIAFVVTPTSYISFSADLSE